LEIHNEIRIKKYDASMAMFFIFIVCNLQLLLSFHYTIECFRMPNLTIKTHGAPRWKHIMGGQLGEFHHMCVKYTLTKCVAFSFGLYFWCLDFISW